MKRFYRVCNTDTQQGLWYHFDGKFTGLIHDDFNFFGKPIPFFIVSILDTI